MAGDCVRWRQPGVWPFGMKPDGKPGSGFDPGTLWGMTVTGGAGIGKTEFVLQAAARHQGGVIWATVFGDSEMSKICGAAVKSRGRGVLLAERGEVSKRRTPRLVPGDESAAADGEWVLSVPCGGRTWFVGPDFFQRAENVLSENSGAGIMVVVETCVKPSPEMKDGLVSLARAARRCGHAFLVTGYSPEEIGLAEQMPDLSVSFQKGPVRGGAVLRGVGPEDTAVSWEMMRSEPSWSFANKTVMDLEAEELSAVTAGGTSGRPARRV